MEDLVKMSPKGQLVVPKDIREKEDLKPTDRFVAIRIKGGIVFKKVNIPSVETDLRSLSKEIENHFKERNINKSDVGNAIKWARKKSS